ncbi:flavin reductase [Poseidonocella sedimentorum]|uniref:Flavin reductase n=1 Tax=Poseidonocella sedimentorum TaxID=871652 RepID=A0A1I6E3A9_9RHOB|nr:flavin reductase [Poseidonocella sedimentorum]SFR12176.1 flavin reductase [Poseidonocella sedimentorum]
MADDATLLKDPAEIDAPQSVSLEAFKSGMALLAGAVNIVTTDGPAGRAGLTASAVCSVTADPPTLLVCVNRASSAAPAFLENDAVCINTAGPGHRDLAMLFGGKTPMEARFAEASWTTGASGAPILTGAVVSFDCRVSSRAVVGSHEVLFCRIIGITEAPQTPALAYFARKFHELEA